MARHGSSRLCSDTTNRAYKVLFILSDTDRAQSDGSQSWLMPVQVP